MMRNRPILLSLLLSLPVIFFLLHHYFYHSPGLYPTGFTVDENVLYMSYARQYLDADTFQLFYSNPFDGNPHSAPIYFQPVNIFLVPAMAMGIPPGLCFSLFGLFMAIACIYMGIRIIRILVPTPGYPVLTSVLFTWGGGLTAIAGIATAMLLPSYAYPSWPDNIFIADPANGWWGLNWGRNLFIPLEAYYHFLFLLNIYLLLKKKWASSLLAAFLLSLSHPFTGISFLLIVTAWVFIEKIFLKNKDIPWWHAIGLALITCFHMWYYLVWLNQFPEHRKLFSQYSAGWTYSLLVAIPAYGLVLAAVLFAAWKFKPLSRFMSLPHQRLFLCWAIISFLLSKHEWFLRPMQPIHFTRGYTWAGLFLLALPGITWGIEYLQKRKWIFFILLAIFLSDNILWTLNILRKKETVEWEGHFTPETREILSYLNKNGSTNDLLVGNAPLVLYTANVFSPVNSWASHPFNTPDKAERTKLMNEYLATGVLPDAWKGRRVLVIIDRINENSQVDTERLKLVFENARYRILTP